MKTTWIDSRCCICGCRMKVETTHGTPPGPDICSQECYDAYWEADARRMPAYAVEVM